MYDKEPTSTQTRWVVGIVTAGLVTGFWFLLVQDRTGFDRRLTAVEVLAFETRQVQIGVVVKLDSRVEDLQRSLYRIEAELAEIKAKKK